MLSCAALKYNSLAQAVSEGLSQLFHFNSAVGNHAIVVARERAKRKKIYSMARSQAALYA
jgi:hypothetical protein